MPKTVSVSIDNLTIALVVASILYALCLSMAYRKVRGLHRIRPELSTKKLLLLSVLVVCAIRLMTIIGVGIMNIANVRAHYSLLPINNHNDRSSSTTPTTKGGGEDESSSSQQSQQEFYDKAMTVLFDLPNCVVVSTYVLLTIIWAECFLESRFHTESMLAWKRRGLLLFMIFNCLLYLTQLSLYASILIATKSLRTYLYAGITGVNFTAVFMVWILYTYLQYKFSGFPFRSNDYQQSLFKLSSVMTLWTITRIVWGLATFAVFLFQIELLQDSHTHIWSFLVLLLLFIVCEIIPIFAMLDYSYMNMIGGMMISSTPNFTTRMMHQQSNNNNSNNINNNSLFGFITTNNNNNRTTYNDNNNNEDDIIIDHLVDPAAVTQPLLQQQQARNNDANDINSNDDA